MARPAALRQLCLWLPLLATTAVATPNSAVAPVTLDITSDPLLGQPIFGDTLGPYLEGRDLTLICSTNDPSLTLTWWEGGKELQALPERSQFMVTSTLELETLSVSDSGRELSCRAAETDVVRTVTLRVTANFEIVFNGNILLQDDTTVAIGAGVNLELNCISQGYSPSVLSWFEGDKEVASQSFRSSYAASSVLAIPAVSLVDSGRRFSCRSEDGARERALEILVFGREGTDGSSNNEENSETTLRIILLVVCVAAVTLIIAMAVLIVRLIRVYSDKGRPKQVTKFSELFKKIPLLSSSNVTKGVPQVQALSYTNV